MAPRRPFGIPTAPRPPPPLPKGDAAANPVPIKPRLVRALPREAPGADEPVPKKEDLVQEDSHVKVNSNALAAILSRLESCQKEVHQLRSVVRDSFLAAASVDPVDEHMDRGEEEEEDEGAGGREGSEKAKTNGGAEPAGKDAKEEKSTAEKEEGEFTIPVLLAK